MLAHAHIDYPNVEYNFATRGQNAFNLALHLGAVFDSRNTVGGVSWLGEQLFDLTEEKWHGLPFTPRPTVLYDGTKDILLTKDEVARHALARNLQCAMTAEAQVAEGLRVLRAEVNPSATARYLLGNIVVGSSNAVGAPMTTGSRGSKRSRGWADADPANGLHIPTIAWREETSWNQEARNPKSLAELALKAPIIVENLKEEEHEAAFERWLSTRAREAAKMQNA